MEPPFTDAERGQLQDVTEWMFNGIQLAEGEVCRDGSCPADLMERWRPWVIECIDLLDGDGAFRHFPGPGSIRDQPAYDMDVLRIIRHRWVGLLNDKNRGK